MLQAGAHSFCGVWLCVLLLGSLCFLSQVMSWHLSVGKVSLGKDSCHYALTRANEDPIIPAIRGLCCCRWRHQAHSSKSWLRLLRLRHPCFSMTPWLYCNPVCQHLLRNQPPARNNQRHPTLLHRVATNQTPTHMCQTQSLLLWTR